MTKFYALFMLFCLPVLFASAQFDKGQKVLAGSVTFSNSKYYYGTDNTNNQLFVAFRPSVASFTKSNQLCGIGLSYSFLHSNSTSNNNTNVPVKYYSHSLGLDVFSQRFFTLAPRFYFTVNTTGSVAYSFGKSTYQLSTTQVRNNSGYSINAGLAPGLSYRLTQRLLFDASLTNLVNVGFSHSESESLNVARGDKSYNNTFAISSSLSNATIGSVGLGFRWLLKK